MKCCADCFGDRHLATQTFPNHPERTIGRCDYCYSGDASLLEPLALRDQFEALTSVYVDDEDGTTLIDLLRKDWLLFPELKRAEAKELLGHVLGDANLPEKKCIPPRHEGQSALERWQEFREELMYSNRYFPRHSFGQDMSERLVELFSYLLQPLSRGAQFFRARLEPENLAFELGQMGPPPKRNSTHGRANPAGIPYLYLASDQRTAISEVRPHTGEVVCVATFNITRTLTIVDLKDPRGTVSPFQLGEEQKIVQLLRDLAFLDFVSAELTRPVLPKAAAIDYVPTQYVCELIKSVGFDGVFYKSSIANGYNLALFNEESASPESLRRHLVKGVSVDTEPDAF